MPLFLIPYYIIYPSTINLIVIYIKFNCKKLCNFLHSFVYIKANYAVTDLF